MSVGFLPKILLTCAGLTIDEAVKVSDARSPDLFAGIGIDGLGHLAMQYAQIVGGSVVAVDRVEETLQMATELGASYSVTSYGRRSCGCDARTPSMGRPSLRDQGWPLIEQARVSSVPRRWSEWRCALCGVPRLLVSSRGTTGCNRDMGFCVDHLLVGCSSRGRAGR